MSVFHGMKRAKGLGSGGNGTGHFIAQRVAGIMLVPLTLFFFYAIVCLVAAKDYAAVKAWFAAPMHMALSIMFMVVGFFEAAIGLQVVVEDYIHHENGKWVYAVAVKGFCLFGALLALVSILRLGLTA